VKLGGQREPKELRARVAVLGVMLVLGLLVLAVNLYRLMVVRYEEFTALSIDNQFKDVRVRAPRGLIRDRRGEVLVDARPSLDVFITPAFCVKCQAEVIPKLALWLGWDEEQRLKVEQAVKDTHGPQRYQELVVQVDLTRDEFDLLTAHQAQLPGVDLEPVPHREYRAGSALAHVVGYMNEITQEELGRLNSTNEDRPPYAMGDYIGRRGVERSFEHLLRGTDGWVKQVVNARGEVMRDLNGEVLKRDEVPPTAGKNLVLSIDARLQAEAERVFPGTAGAIVMMETKTGFILAMVSRPSFDPNEMTGRVSSARLAALSRDPLQPMLFRAVAEHYHPGSTFKVVSLLAGLKSGAFTATTTVNCPGGYQLGARRWRCDNERGHGPVQAHTAIAFSCDTYFYHLSDVIGIDPIAKVAKDLGFGAVTNFGVAAEVPGIIPDTAYHDKNTPGGYTKGMALNASIGQGDVNVTPLQLAVVYSAIANGGDVLQPQIVKRVETPEGALVEQFTPKPTRRVDITPEQRTVLVEGLKGVVNEAGGTGFRARQPDVVVAGKTGTAQVQRLGAVRLKAAQMDYWERDHAWFASFAPADDPEVTIVVLNEHSGFGGASSAPAAGALFRKYFDLKKTDGQAFGGAVAVSGEAPAPAPPAPVAMPPVKPPRDSTGNGLAEAPRDAGAAQLAGPETPVKPDAVQAPPHDPGAPLVPPREEP
jgi:penicillin-binding protein 2